MRNSKKNQTKEIWEVHGGRFFKLDEKTYLKTGEPPSGGCYLAVELGSGELTYIGKNHHVELVNFSKAAKVLCLLKRI